MLDKDKLMYLMLKNDFRRKTIIYCMDVPIKRLEKGLSIADIAAQLLLPEQIIYDIESFKIENVNRTAFEKVFSLLGIDYAGIDYIFNTERIWLKNGL